MYISCCCCCCGWKGQSLTDCCTSLTAPVWPCNAAIKWICIKTKSPYFIVKMFVLEKKSRSGLKWHSKSLCVCSMWRHGEHNGGDDLCSNTAVNEWASVIRADEGTWRHLALTQQDWRFTVKHAHIKNSNFSPCCFSWKFLLFCCNGFMGCLFCVVNKNGTGILYSKAWCLRLELRSTAAMSLNKLNWTKFSMLSCKT